MTAAISVGFRLLATTVSALLIVQFLVAFSVHGTGCV